MLYKNKTSMVRLSDGGADYFEIIAGTLQGDTFASYLFIICQDYIHWTSKDLIKENG